MINKALQDDQVLEVNIEIMFDCLVIILVSFCWKFLHLICSIRLNNKEVKLKC